MKKTSASPASYDLHLHTYWSYDATAEPEQYFHQARKLGVRCLAITEHHNIDCAPEVEALAKQFPELRVIPAAELSVNTSIGAVDLLCYNLPSEPVGRFAEVLAEYNDWQRASGGSKSAGMQALGYDYSDEARLELLRTYRPERVLARQGATAAIQARELQYFQDRGYFSSDEEKVHLMRRLAEVQKRPLYPDVHRVVTAVKEAGGLVVIAHPTGYFLRNDLARMDALREECQLDGIECAHRAVPPELSTFYRDYCVKHNLVSTAGSDCHHAEDILTPPENWGHTPLRRFACHIGEDIWLEEFLERLN